MHQLKVLGHHAHVSASGRRLAYGALHLLSAACTTSRAVTNLDHGPQRAYSGLQDYPEHRLQFFNLLRSITNACFGTLFTMSPGQLKLVIDSIVWAFRHTAAQRRRYRCAPERCMATESFICVCRSAWHSRAEIVPGSVSTLDRPVDVLCLWEQ